MSPSQNQRFLAVIMVLAVAVATPGVADVVELQPDQPERYVVQKGDTLWDISTRFLKSPWQWAKIWKINEQIANPHLIYPGDIILLRWVEGQPVITVERGEVVPGVPRPAVEEVGPLTGPGRGDKLLPRVRSDPREEAIPTIPPSAIGPFLTRPLVVGRRELKRAGYVTIGMDDRIALGDHSEFYARGLKGRSDEYYSIIRKGKALRDPENQRLLGYEAIYLGDAELLEPGDPAKLVVTRVAQEILPTDRLVPTPRPPPLPYYQPRAPERKVSGWIIHAHNAVSEVGPYTVVAISLGERDGMERGHVLRIWRHVGARKDPVTRRPYRIPDEDTGLLMIFRTFKKVSYGLVMSAVRPVHMLDKVTTP